ncbi:hypothetical protein J7E73_07680 [Paenibacillus albidus]|uniref:hypothetical protein n=1 Tax=Paenibacillus albidus TaxID=2041023 RepID=UPI001BE548E3|nr:hypothetical protein [Paenibacillus albidus]MBT2289014.1 hypothetical protein [Paenibacillus albidus]
MAKTKSTTIRKQAKQLKGRPVCVTLNDGRSYVGFITGFEKDGLVFSRQYNYTRKNKTSKKTSSSRSRKASVSGLMPLLGSFFGGAGGAAGGGLGGIMGMIGMVQKVMPLMKMGYNVIKSIRPFIGGLKSFMG